MDLSRSDTIGQSLSTRLRSDNLYEYVGQKHLLYRGKPLRESPEHESLDSMIFWGPPGAGRTNLARLIVKFSNDRWRTPPISPRTVAISAPNCCKAYSAIRPDDSTRVEKPSMTRYRRCTNSYVSPTQTERFIYGGCDPIYISRRAVRMASE